MEQMKVVSIIVLFFGSLPLSAQTFKERLEDIQKEYAAIETVHIKMSIEVFETEERQSPYFKQMADIKRQAHNYSYQFGSTYMLMNSECLVVVDKDSREIIYTKRSVEAENRLFSDPFKMNLDSILSLYENPSFLGSEKNGDHFRIFQKKGEVKQVDLFIDELTNLLNRIEYRYNDGHYVAIQFILFDKNPVFEADTFREEKYVMEDKGMLRASNTFLGYHVAKVDGNNE